MGTRVTNNGEQPWRNRGIGTVGIIFSAVGALTAWVLTEQIFLVILLFLLAVSCVVLVVISNIGKLTPSSDTSSNTPNDGADLADDNSGSSNGRERL